MLRGRATPATLKSCFGQTIERLPGEDCVTSRRCLQEQTVAAARPLWRQAVPLAIVGACCLCAGAANAFMAPEDCAALLPAEEVRHLFNSKTACYLFEEKLPLTVRQRKSLSSGITTINLCLARPLSLSV